jgi:hypothetical protein
VLRYFHTAFAGINVTSADAVAANAAAATIKIRAHRERGKNEDDIDTRINLLTCCSLGAAIDTRKTKPGQKPFLRIGMLSKSAPPYNPALLSD